MVTSVDHAGGSAALITLTLQHNPTHRLVESWDALRYAWSRICSGKIYLRERTQFGIEGWCAAVEVTRGESGWHPHLHVLVLFDGPMSADMIQELAGRWFLRWERALGRRGFSALEFRGGLDARVVAMDDSGALGQYLAKIAMEVTGGSTKDGRHGSRSPFAILRDGLATGLADDIEAWWEWEKASHNRRQLTWSQGLRDRYGVGPEQSDEEIAEEDHGSDDLITLPAETWLVVKDQAEQLLAAAEQDGLTGAALWLDQRRLRWGWAGSKRGAPRPPNGSTERGAGD